jgi:hypothetical protein
LKIEQSKVFSRGKGGDYQFWSIKLRFKWVTYVWSVYLNESLKKLYKKKVPDMRVLIQLQVASEMESWACVTSRDYDASGLINSLSRLLVTVTIIANVFSISAIALGGIKLVIIVFIGLIRH